MKSQELPAKRSEARTRTRRWVVATGAVLAILVFAIPKAGVQEAGDNTVEYMDEALRLVTGEELALRQLRGPGLPALMALGYLISEPSVEAAFLVIRVLHVLAIALGSLTAARLFGGWAGFGCAVLLGTAGYLEFLSVWITPDVPATAFILAGVLFTAGMVRGSRAAAFAAGLSFALAFLTKEYSIVFLALPFCFLVNRRQRTTSYAWRLAAFSVAVAGCVLPWLGYLTYRGFPAHAIFGYLSPAAGGDWIGAMSFGAAVGFIITRMIVGLGDGLAGFLMDYWSEAFILWPALSVAGFYGLWRARESRNWQLVVFAAMLFIPVILGTGMFGMGGRQLLPFYFLSFMMLAGMLAELARRISARSRIAAAALFLVPLSAQLFAANPSLIEIVRHGATVDGYTVFPWRAWWTEDEFEVRGSHNRAVRELAAWISSEIPRGSNVAMGVRYPEGLNLFLGFDYLQPVRLGDFFSTTIEEDLREGRLMSSDEVLAIWPYGNFTSGQLRHRAFQFYLVRTFREAFASSDYLMVSRTPFYDTWLPLLQSLELRYSSDRIRAFRVFPEAPIPLRGGYALHADRRTLPCLQWLRDNYPSEYERLGTSFAKLGVDLPRSIESAVAFGAPSGC